MDTYIKRHKSLKRERVVVTAGEKLAFVAVIVFSIIATFYLISEVEGTQVEFLTIKFIGVALAFSAIAINLLRKFLLERKKELDKQIDKISDYLNKWSSPRDYL